MDEATQRLITKLTLEIGVLRAENIELQVNLEMKEEEIDALKMNQAINNIANNENNENITEVTSHEQMENQN